MPECDSPATRSLQGKAAAARRWNRPDQDEIRRDYAAQKLADHVRQVVDSAPPLTDEQRGQIAALLRPLKSGGGLHDAA